MAKDLVDMADMADNQRPGYYDSLNPRDIWSIRQNKPTLIARDLELYGVSREATYAILLGRGAFKWLAVRRKLIRLKDIWKGRVRMTIDAIHRAKDEHDSVRHAYWKGYLKAYEEARAEVRELCHSSRFVAPDNDQYAQAWLESLALRQAKGEIGSE